MRNLFVVVIAMFAFSLTGCMTASRELAQAAHPKSLLISDPQVCVSNLTYDGMTVDQLNKTMSFCMELAKLEADRAKETAKASAKAQAAEAQRNPCDSWFMAPSYCYGARVGYGYSSTYGTAGVNYNYQSPGASVRPPVVTTKPPSGGTSGGQNMNF